MARISFTLDIRLPPAQRLAFHVWFAAALPSRQAVIYGAAQRPISSDYYLPATGGVCLDQLDASLPLFCKDGDGGKSPHSGNRITKTNGQLQTGTDHFTQFTI